MSELIQLRTSRAPSSVRWRFALFEFGFRPFFLGAGLFGALSIVHWMLDFSTGLSVGHGAWAPLWLHAHEMVFGFTSAAVAGFLLTATPNWTQHPPVTGCRLGALFALWCAARVLFTLPSPDWLLSAVDLAFLPALGLTLWPSIRRGKSKNYVFLLLLAVAWGGNLLCHLEPIVGRPGWMSRGLRAGIYAVVMMMVILAGRIVPGFTQNALRRRGEPNETTSDPRTDLAAKATTLAALGSDLFALPPTLTSTLAAAAAALMVWRMRGWRTRQSLSEPIVWILHAGHLWVAIALGSLAVDAFSAAFVGAAALHAFTAGAIGCMVIGIMTRASLGHTGRPLKVSRSIALAYALVLLGAVLRVFGPLLVPGAYHPLVVAGGVLWATGYLLFTIVYAPILISPRLDE